VQRNKGIDHAHLGKTVTIPSQKPLDFGAMGPHGRAECKPHREIEFGFAQTIAGHAIHPPTFTPG
jgi:hypothetical protein